MCKFLLSVIGHVMYRLMEESIPPNSTSILEAELQCNDLQTSGVCNGNETCPVTLVQRCPLQVLKHALINVPNQNTEYTLRNVACKLAENYTDQVRLFSYIFLMFKI